MADETLFSKLEPGSFDGIPVPVVSMRLMTGSAAAFHKYPNRPGVDVESMGREPVTGAIVAAYFNDLPEAVGTTPLWPDAIARLRERVQRQKSGSLTIPIFGVLPKCHIQHPLIETYEAGRQDGCFVEFQFIEDSKDELAKSSIRSSALSKLDSSMDSALNALAAAQLKLQDTLLSLDDGRVSPLEFVRNLQGNIQRFQDDIARPIQQASALVGAIDDTLKTARALKDPANWEAASALRDLKANTLEAIEDMPGPRPVKRAVATAITNASAFADEHGNTLKDFLSLNVLKDPNKIGAGATLFIYADGE